MASGPLRIALAQIDPTVGDIDGNAERISAMAARARSQGAEVCLFPELALTGYPPEDLLLRTGFLAATDRALQDLAGRIPTEMPCLVGAPERADDVYNGLAVLAGGRVQGRHRKVHLPNYGVFDEQRYFREGVEATVVDVGEARLGLTVCEDVWEPGPPATVAAVSGATVIVNASASPYHRGKGASREAMIAQRARDTGAYVCFCNLVGGQDELVFDGRSVVVDQAGDVIGRARQFEEDLLVCDLDLERAGAARLRETRQRALSRKGPADVEVLAALDRTVPDAPGAPRSVAEPLGELEEVWGALVTGLRDYARKNGFGRCVLGLSGGIDSALVAVLAADALGSPNVTCLVMPSEFSSQETQADARQMAVGLGADMREIPIDPVREAFAAALGAQMEGPGSGVGTENVQARIRGTLVMALSNAHGWLALATGNKSEMAVGYSTLYGDMAGGLAPIKDVPKTLVYALAEHRNRVAEERGQPTPIPRSILERPPTAELRAGQLDTDSLPPYDLLDRILEGYVERDEGLEALVAAGLPADVVAETIARVDRSEHKRRQAPPGIKITPKAFGRDRRLPITNRFTERAPLPR